MTEPCSVIRHIESWCANSRNHEEIKRLLTLLISMADPGLQDGVRNSLENSLTELEELRPWLVNLLQPHEFIRKIHLAIDCFNPSELSPLFNTWLSRLCRDAFTLLDQPIRVLCAYSLVEDHVRPLDQKELNQFMQWSASQLGYDDSQLIWKTHSVERDHKHCHSLVETVAILNNPPNHQKYYLDSPELIKLLSDYFTNPSTQIMLGGSSAIQAKTLSHLPNLSVDASFYYTPHLSPELTDELSGVKIAFPKDTQWQRQDASRIDGDRQPKRCGYIFDIDDEVNSNSPHHWKQKERLIFRTRHYNHPIHRCAKLEIWRDGRRLHEWIPSETYQNGDWPSIPLFASQSWNAQEDILQFHVACDSSLEQIANSYDIILLDGLNALADIDLDDKFRYLLIEILKDQIICLKKQNPHIHIHIELSIPDARAVDIIQEVIKAGIDSAGVNPEELLDITSNPHSPLNVWPRPSRPESIYERYHRGSRLLDQLEHLKWLYIHGNEIDLSIYRHASPAQLEKNVNAILFAKALVISEILERSKINNDEINQIPALQAAKGYLALLDFAYDLARLHCQDKSQEEVKHVTKELARRGYWIGDGHYPVAAVPVIWPGITHRAITTGAGDITSGIMAVLSYRTGD